MPVHVIPLLADRMGEGTPSWRQASRWGGILPAVWSFQLAARARGLGSTWTTFHLVHEAEIAEADPTDDVNGADAAAKMAILARLAFDTARYVDAHRLYARDRSRDIVRIQPAGENHIASCRDNRRSRPVDCLALAALRTLV